VNALLVKAVNSSLHWRKENGPMTQQPKPCLVTIAEAAKQLSLSTSTLYQLIRYEDMPVYRFGKTVIRLKMSEVQEWLESRKGESN